MNTYPLIKKIGLDIGYPNYGGCDSIASLEAYDVEYKLKELEDYINKLRDGITLADIYINKLEAGLTTSQIEQINWKEFRIEFLKMLKQGPL